MNEILLSGTQALVRACLIQKQRDRTLGLSTAGYVTGYRGSPLGAVDQAFIQEKNLLSENEILFQEALNEDLAATALWGTQQSNLHGEGTHVGVFGLWYGKGPGVDRSGDVLRHANLAGTSTFGGVVMAMGDDHTGESSTTLHQSDYGLVDAMIPIFSPAGVQEILDYCILGWALSRHAGVWSGLKCVKDTVEIKEIVDTNAERIVISNDSNTKQKNELGIRLIDSPVDQEERLHRQKLPAVKLFVKDNKIDKAFYAHKASKIGILSAGKNWLDLLSALDLLGLDAQKCKALGITCYKVGVVWPLEDSRLREWAKNLDLILVVEEKRKLLEGQVKNILFNDTVKEVKRTVEGLFFHVPYKNGIALKRPHSAIRKGDYKLLKFQDNEEIFLFNLANNKNEQKNLVEENPQKAKELEKLLMDYLQEVHAPKWKKGINWKGTPFKTINSTY